MLRRQPLGQNGRGDARAEANCYSLGELIHNDDVVQHLRSEGLTVADGPEQIPQGASVIIRSHGVSRAEFEAVQRTGATVYDATCPKVKRIHEIVAEASAEGRQPVIIGAADHPEVRAICGWCTSPMWSMMPHSSPRVSLTAPSTVQNR